MRTETIYIYKFKELSEEAQQKALEKAHDINVNHNWWENTYEEAKNIGMEINEFTLYRGKSVESELLWAGSEVCETIIKEHGENCTTHKLAKEFQEKYKALDKKYKDDEGLLNFDEESFDLDSDLKEELQKEYSNILNIEREHLMSEEAIKETIISNEYEYTEEGTQF